MARADDEVPPGPFFMLGVIHRDGRNEEILRKWMDILEPGVVTLELSPYGLTFRQAVGGVYRKKIDDIICDLRSGGHQCLPGDVDDLYAYIDIPREFAIAEDYCRRSGAPLYPVDMDLFSWTKLEGIDELISRENIEKSLAGKTPGKGGREKILANLYFRSGVTAFSYTDEMALRDRFMCRSIGLLRRRFSGRRFLHVAGWQHLKDPLDLYAQFDPVKIFPYD